MSNTLHPYSQAAESAVVSDITHEAISARAKELWLEQDCPDHCDEAIWLEAEAEMLAIHERRYRHPHLEVH
jgi:hypothetical protein